jgi:hypothetical protein
MLCAVFILWGFRMPSRHLTHTTRQDLMLLRRMMGLMADHRWTFARIAHFSMLHSRSWLLINSSCNPRSFRLIRRDFVLIQRTTRHGSHVLLQRFDKPRRSLFSFGLVRVLLFLMLQLTPVYTPIVSSWRHFGPRWYFLILSLRYCVLSRDALGWSRPVLGCLQLCINILLGMFLHYF